MGVNILPCCIYDIDNKELTLTAIYKTETTDRKMDYHRSNCEIKNFDDNPIPIYSEDEWIQLFKESLPTMKEIFKEVKDNIIRITKNKPLNHETAKNK